MKILVCFDGSEQSYKALKTAKEMALAYEAEEVTLIHVYPEKEASVWQAVNENKAKAPKALSTHERLQVEKFIAIKNMMNQADKEFDRTKVKVSKRIIKGNPVQKITEIAEKEDFNIIVIGSRGLGGLKKFMLGSVSNGVLHEAKVNVLVVK